MFMHPLPVRIFHWSNMISISLLTWSGMYIHSPVSLKVLSTMDDARFLHFIMMYVVFWGVFYRIGFSLLSGDYKDWVFQPRDFKDLPGLLKYYLFLADHHHHFEKYNPGQKLLYTIWPIMIFIQAVTGFCLYQPAKLGWLSHILGGVAFLRQIHYLSTWFFICSAAVHIYLVLLSGWKVMWSMVSGYIDEETLQQLQED
ncbi:MAG: cytochrome b/b6 domain-containing protein [Carboxydocellales bacterium]